MACYKLTSCSASPNDSIVLYTTDILTPGIVPYYTGNLPVELNAPNPGVCFTVSLIEEAHCPCIGAIDLDIFQQCVCTTTYLCYTLTSCVDPGFTVDVITNLNAYVGQLIEVYEYPGVCFTVTGNIVPANCVGVVEEVTCIIPCDCASSLHCYELTNCTAPFAVINVSYFGVIALNDVIKVLPVQPATGLCWTVTDDNFTPCQPGLPVITSVINFADCPTCLGAPPCYSLTSCDGQTVIYSQSNLAAIVNTTVITNEYPLIGCVFVALSQICNAPVSIDPLLTTPCICGCYTLTDCTGTILPFNTFVDLSGYIGQTVNLDEYGGCGSPCFEVSATVGPCSSPQLPITVSINCNPGCLPCDTLCYDVVDCETQVVFATLTSPTANGVDLSLYVGQVIGKICDNPNANCTEGCWEIKPGTNNCAQQLSKYVYNIYDNCSECLNTCFGLLNCETLVVDYKLKYTIPNPNALPNPNTLLNTVLGSLCFTVPEGGCVAGCYTLILEQDCTTSIDWSDVVSFTNYQNCTDCTPKCYLLTECGVQSPAIILADNDLSSYVGSIVKYNGLCYTVSIAQSCVGAITINNITASFQTCEECNYCDCPEGYTRIDNICQQISTVPATLSPTTYTAAPGTVSPNNGSLGTHFYTNITANPSPIVEIGNQFEDAATTPIPFVTNIIGVWGGPGSSRLNTVGVWTTVPPGPLNQWIGFSQCIDLLVATTYCIGIGGDDFIRIKHNGNILVEATNNNAFNYNYWHVFEITLQPGLHVITMEGQNAGGNAAFGAEIYRATSIILQGYTTSLQVQAVTIFSTYNEKSLAHKFQTGETSGYSCSPGYAFAPCNNNSCSLIETVPYVACPVTFKVTPCAGQSVIDPFITSTDLSAYLIGTYKVCMGQDDPWPEGCYCVTVEQIASETASPIGDIFQQTAYSCCKDCLQICYLLTACTQGINPVVVCNNLEAVIGKVIKIEGCGDICWIVSLSQTCDEGLLIPGAVFVYDDCTECLPPVPPIPPPYDLHLRKIKPGWNSPNSCYTTATIERINCSFGQQVYNQMLSIRYGINVCCDSDLDDWDIKKQLMDYDLLTDPNMCKSTLCDCKAPCLIDVVLTLLPYCADPIIIDAVIDVPCLPPVFVGAVITFVLPEEPCYCFTVEYSSEGPTTIQYFDCCCVLQSQVIPAGQGTIPICGTTAPITYNDPIVVTNTGLCGVAPACVPPPPACSCWQIENPIFTGEALSYNVAELCPCPPGGCVGQVVTLQPGQVGYACSILPPSIEFGLAVVNLGNCGTYCGPIPRVCVCYLITILDDQAGCTFDYIDCDGNPVVNHLPSSLQDYVCATTVPTSPCPILDPLNPPYTITSTPWVCVNGVCGPPFACNCYSVVVDDTPGSHTYTYYDCTGTLQSDIGGQRTAFICGSLPSNLGDTAITITPAPGNPGCLGNC